MSEDKESHERRLAGFQHERYQAAVVDRAAALRRLADRIEREGMNVRPGHAPHTMAAFNVLHELSWGIANINMDMLVAIAADADYFARLAEAAPEAPA